MTSFPSLVQALGQFEIVMVWGFVATLVLSVGMYASQGLGISRLSLPFLLGFMVTGRRDHAALYGLGLYVLGGWVSAFIYAWLFATIGEAGFPLGVAVGLLHALSLLTIVLPVLPYIHPRVASTYAGPTARRRLEPPGFLGLHYGRMTPVTTILSHLAYGGLLGWALGH